MRGRAALALGAAVLAATLLLSATATREVAFVPLSSLEDDEDEVCRGAACLDKIWCVCNERNPLAQFKSVFGEVSFSVNDGNKEAVCVRGDSSDSRMHIEVLRDMLRGKPPSEDENSAPPGCEASGSGAVVRRLRKSTDVSWTENLFGKGIEHAKAAAGLGCLTSAAYSPYGVSCVVLERSTQRGGDEPLVLTVTRRKAEWRGPAVGAAGLVLIWTSPWLSEQIFLYYASGTTIGVFLCVFLLTWFVLKRFTSSKNSAWVLITAQAFAGMVASYMFNMVEVLMDSYQNELLYYLVGSSLVSFALTYYALRGSNGQPSGPSPVLKDLVRWFLKLSGYVCVYHSTRSLRWSAIILAGLFLRTVVLPAFTNPWTGLLDFVNPNRGVAKMRVRYVAGRLLTEEEFKLQGEMETDRQTRKLFASKQFQEWVARNAGRIQIKPPADDTADDSDGDDDE